MDSEAASDETIQTGERLVREQLDQALRELKKHATELEHSNRDLEQFAYVASHDLQTPLRKVRSFTALLRDELEPLEEWMGHEKRANVKKYLAFIISGAEQSQELVNGLLSFSRIGRKLEMSPVPIQKAIGDALFILQDDIADKKVTVAQDHEMPTVVADESLLKRVFQNLIGNAIKFRSEEPPCIRIRSQDQGDCWEFTVEDNGIGIDEAHQDRVFQIFQRLGNRKRGMGLGLALCKKIIESHGGNIWFTSTPGEGSAFHFTLPKEAAQHAPDTVHDASE